MGLVLRQDRDLPHLGVREVGQHEVDQPVGAAERHRRLGPVHGQRHQSLALATREDDRKHFGSRSHGVNVGVPARGRLHRGGCATMPAMSPDEEVTDADALAPPAADRLSLSLLTREYPPSIYGGAGVHVAQLVPQLRRLIDVDVQCMGEPRDGATAHAENFPPGANPALRVFGADLSMVASIPEVDLVHSHTWYANLAGHLAGLFFDIPHVVSAHSLEPHRPWKAEQLGGGYRLSSWAERTAFEAADAVIAVSAGMRADILASYPDLDPDLVHVVRNGIDPEEFAPDPDTDVTRSIGMDLDRPTVVFVGRITRQKGLIHLVRAAEQFDPDTQLVLLAGAPDTPEIATQIGAAFAHLRSTRGNVIWIEEMLPGPACARSFRTPRSSPAPRSTSRWGSSIWRRWRARPQSSPPRSAASPRWWSTAKPATWCPTIRRRAEDPDAVAAFETDLAAKVNALTSEPDRARRFGLAGRQRCIDEFSWAKIAAETVEVYQTALRQHGRR